MEVAIAALLRDGRIGLAVGDGAASIVAGYLAVWITTATVRRLRRLA